MICCVCLLENLNNMNIFDDIGQQLKIPEIINKYLWFKPQPDNFLTTQICTICWSKLDDFHIFYETVEKAHREFENCAAITNIKTELLSSSPIKLEDVPVEEHINTETAIEIEENVDIKNPLEQNVNDDEISFNGESDNEDFEPMLTSEQEESTEEDEVASEKEENFDDNNGRKKGKTRKKNERKQEETKDNVKKRKVQRLDPVHTDEMIKKHIPMGCNLCVFVGSNFPDIVKHFRSEHPNIRPYIMCCDKKLSKRFFLAQHALKHENPNCFRCEECSRSFTTICGLRTHNQNYHASSEDLIYVCDSCPKKFARRNLLELHKTSHIPKEQWQYVCDKCPTKKTFASTYLLNVHTIMRHKKEANICPVCAKEIKDKKSYEKHVRLHYEDSGPRVKCPYPDCDSWLKDEDNLKQHLTRHNPEGIIYKCDQCNKECKNRRALTNHKRYAHTNAIFQCEQCDKTFKKAISLREHMAHHTGETLYKCPFCTRTFNSNANMHAHKKKQHPVEWEEWRKTKRGSAQKLINDKNPLNHIDDTVTELNNFL